MNPEVFGVFATITSLVFMAMGLPVQIYKIHKTKSTQGVSLFTQCTLFLTTVSWCVYSIKISNSYILVANLPGAFFALIILFQFWLYRKALPIQGCSLSEGEMDHLQKYGEMWFSREMLRSPVRGEAIQINCKRRTVFAFVKDFFPVGKPEDGNYRMLIKKLR